MSENVYRQDTKVQRSDREALNGHRSRVIWFTGLSGSGKSTIAAEVHKRLQQEGIHSYMLDGDNIRLGINKDLDFTEEGRKENIRRIAEVAKLFVDAGMVVLTSFISPFRQERTNAREIIGTEDFSEVYVNCPLEVCEQRDVKGLYARARKGEIKHFTGIDSPYEEPLDPEIEVRSDQRSVAECAEDVIRSIKQTIRIEHT